jgi:mannose/fructose/N-acetylgalactosamine-specific phosphotransferase system component IIC
MVAVTIFLSLSIVVLFTTMVLSSIAASEAKRGNTASAQKYSMWSAITSGIVVFLVVVVLFLYLNSEKIVAGTHSVLGAAQGAVGRYLPPQ